MLFAGIDVGQSGTVALVGDGERILGRGTAGAGDEVGVTAHSTRLRDALHDALAAALRDAALANDARFDAIVAGISGYEGRSVGVAPELPAARVALMHDAPIAHAAALGGDPGVVVIAGTGSVAFARAEDGVSRTTGGWGYLFGDEGSAFWIARRAFEHAIRCTDGCGERIAAHFECSSLRAVANAFYAGTISRDRFAAFAPVALADAQSPAQSCAGIAQPALDAAPALAQLAAGGAFDPRGRVAFIGGLTRSAWLMERVRASTLERMPDARVSVASAEPAQGALLLARRLPR